MAKRDLGELIEDALPAIKRFHQNENVSADEIEVCEQLYDLMRVDADHDQLKPEYDTIFRLLHAMIEYQRGLRQTIALVSSPVTQVEMRSAG